MQNKSINFEFSDVRNGFCTRKPLPGTTQKIMHFVFKS